MKRLFDISLALVCLLITSPLWLVISVAIYLESGQPVFFTQRRCARGLRRFDLIKFRSMRNGRHKIINLPVDNRVTKVGKVLRGTGLDSLPELLNILKGDISFVGPRPMPYEVEDEPGYTNIEKIPGHYKRSLVTPGLTGLSQIYCTKYCSRRIKFKFDNLYVANQSLWLDLRLMVLSAWITLKGKWESKEKW